MATNMGRLDDVIRLLNQNPNLINSRRGNLYRMTPLQIAAGTGRNRILDELLRRGANVNLPNRFGWDALYHAALRGNIHAVEKLAAHGARLNKAYPGVAGPVTAREILANNNQRRRYDALIRRVQAANTIKRYAKTAKLRRGLTAAARLKRKFPFNVARTIMKLQ